MTRAMEIPGVNDIWFNIERRTATISYNPSLTCPDSIKAPFAGQRYNMTPYNPADSIIRNMGLRMELTDSASARRAITTLNGRKRIDPLYTLRRQPHQQERHQKTSYRCRLYTHQLLYKRQGGLRIIQYSTWQKPENAGRRRHRLRRCRGCLHQSRHTKNWFYLFKGHNFRRQAAPENKITLRQND